MQQEKRLVVASPSGISITAKVGKPSGGVAGAAQRRG